MAVTTTPSQKVGWGTANFVVIALALIPVLWMVSLSFKTPAAILDPSFIPKSWTTSNYSQILKTSQFIRPLVNSIGIGLIATLIAVVFASMAAYAIARLEFPGKGVLIGMALLIAMFPQIALVTPMFNIERYLRPVQHLARPDHPLRRVRPAAGHLHPVGVLPRDPLGAGEGGQGRRGDAVPGVHQGHRPAGGAGHGHHGDPGLPVLLERVPVRDLVHLDAGLADRARSPSQYFSGGSQFTVPTGPIAAAAVVITIPIIIFVVFFQRRIVAGLTSGAVKG